MCKQLDINDIDDEVFCQHGIQPMPRYRDKSDKEKCLKCFVELSEENHWHEKFSWE
jgi:hypothetical protein